MGKVLAKLIRNASISLDPTRANASAVSPERIVLILTNVIVRCTSAMNTPRAQTPLAHTRVHVIPVSMAMAFLVRTNQ